MKSWLASIWYWKDSDNGSMRPALLLALLPLALFAGEYGQPSERTIFRALERKDPALLKQILRDHAESVAFRDSVAHSPLMRAILSGNQALAGQLLMNGADANPPGVPEPPLHLSILLEMDQVFSLLLEKGAAVEALTYGGHSPLHMAAHRGNALATAKLLERKARSDLPDGQGRTPLHLAAMRGHTQIMRLLIAANALREARSKAGLTPFLEAVAANQLESVTFLLSTDNKEWLKATREATDPAGRGALHLAAEVDSPELVRLLLFHGLNKDLQDKAGFSPLHLAARDGREGALRALLDAGANPRLLSLSLQTPLELLNTRDRSFANAARIQFFLQQAAYRQSIEYLKNTSAQSDGHTSPQ